MPNSGTPAKRMPYVPSSVDELIAEVDKWRSIADALAVAVERKRCLCSICVDQPIPALTRYREAVS